jgi:hypothetical protein
MSLEWEHFTFGKIRARGKSGAAYNLWADFQGFESGNITTVYHTTQHTRKTWETENFSLLEEAIQWCEDAERGLGNV